MAKFHCLECDEDFEEGSEGGAGNGLAICKPCCRAIVDRIWFPEEEVVSVTDLVRGEMDCKNCADNGMTIPAMKVLNGVGYCELCLHQRDELMQTAPPPSVPDPTPSVPEKQEEKKEMAKQCFCGRELGHRGMHRGVKRGPRKPKEEPLPRDPVRLTNVSAATSERYNALMDEFLAKRAEIDKAIEALKQLENYI